MPAQPSTTKDMRIVHRMQQFVSHLGCSVNEAADRCGIKRATLHKALKLGRGFHSDTLEAVLKTHPYISAEWLLRGEGPMTRSKSIIATLEQTSPDAEGSLRQLVDNLQKDLAATQAELASYKEQNEDYRIKLRNLREHNEQLNAKLETARTGVGTAADRVACSLSDQVDKLTIENERLSKELAELRVNTASLPYLTTGEYTQIREERDRLRTYVQQLKHNIELAQLALKGA